MVTLGIHLGMAAGHDEAVQYAKDLGCSTVQIFTHNPRTFAFKPLDMEACERLRTLWKQNGINEVFSHCNYLINLGSSENNIFHGSLSTVEKELDYAKAFGCGYFVLHVGKHKEAGLEAGMAQVAKAINQLRPAIKRTGVMVLFETVAGQGTEIGVKFEELDKLISMLDKDVQQHIGVTVDTCHIFAAGYDIRTRDGVERTIAEIERTFGIRRIKLIHVNDSKGELGANLDRHEHLGKGMIGVIGLKAFLTHPKLRDIPMVIETPVDEEIGQEEDLAVLKGFFK